MPDSLARPRNTRLSRLLGVPATGTALAVILAVGLSGCASGSSSTGPASGSAESAGSSSTVTVDEHAAGTTVKVRPGTTVQVELHSTYWSMPSSSAPDLLQPSGAPQQSAAPSCRPGGGCGTVSARYVALRTGTGQVTATRTSCGEAMACPPGQGSFAVTVEISG